MELQRSGLFTQGQKESLKDGHQRWHSGRTLASSSQVQGLSPATVGEKKGGGRVVHHRKQHNDFQHNNTQHSVIICDTQHNNTVIMFSVVILSVVFYLCAKCH